MMKARVMLVTLVAVVLLLSFGQAAKCEIPFVISYYDNDWKSIPATPTGYSNVAGCNMNVANTSTGKTPEVDMDDAG